MRMTSIAKRSLEEKRWQAAVANRPDLIKLLDEVDTQEPEEVELSAEQQDAMTRALEESKERIRSRGRPNHKN